jgi:hypothetical protein
LWVQVPSRSSFLYTLIFGFGGLRIVWIKELKRKVREKGEKRLEKGGWEDFGGLKEK